MIASLKGTIKLTTDKFIILTVNDVGYKVHCPAQTLSQLPDAESLVELYVHSYIREATFDLYGFLNFEELEFFEQLIAISGIGPKAALGIMAIASVGDLKASIASGQVGLLTKVSGIGKKTAERVVLELKNKISSSVSKIKTLVSDEDALDALISLGYTRSQASQALAKVPADVKSVEDKVKEALKLLAR